MTVAIKINGTAQAQRVIPKMYTIAIILSSCVYMYMYYILVVRKLTVTG